MATIDIFELTTRPEEKLFFTKDDPSDIRYGEIINSKPTKYSDAHVVILGCPQDHGVARNNGRVGARDAPNSIRGSFYKLPISTSSHKNFLFDIGDTVVEGSLEEIHHRHATIVQQILSDGKTIIVLGGGNDVSYPDCKALYNVTQSTLGINIDAHFDVRLSPTINSGSPYRQILEENLIDTNSFYEIGSQSYSNSYDHQKYLQEKGVAIYSLEDARVIGIEKLIHGILSQHLQQKSIFWGLDMDAVRSCDAPGVSAPSPIGFTSEEIAQIARLAGKNSASKIFEITEVNPTFDLDNRTSKLAAILLYFFLEEKAKLIGKAPV